MRNTGNIKLRITFEAVAEIAPPVFEKLRSVMLEQSLNYQVVFDDFEYSKKSFRFTVKYKINQNITGIINNIKTTTSRKVKDLLKDDKAKPSPNLSNLPMAGFSQAFEIKNKTKRAFWEQGYSYENHCPDPPFLGERRSWKRKN